ncbi:M16 family metallopeptidase [Hymenobacter jejuensis]|nr:pitrilysin family protein [Hymenobacter jejuensis]
MICKPFILLGLGSALALSPAAQAQQKAPAKPAMATTNSTGGTRLVEKVTRKGSELVIPYEKYVLPNGLTLLVAEDHSDPLVHVDVTYHVGSARETIGKSGFAHFFEHMMFQGSDHVKSGEHPKIISAAGGSMNGSTNRDRTNYFETLPSNQLETALWLEADRMGFLLDAVTQQKFEIQRATVKNERGQSVDNRPYGLADELKDRALYPYAHPYSWSVIGSLEDLDRSNVDDLKNFFLRWYGPNNATLTVGGDVKPAEVVKLVEKYFGSIKRGPAVADMKVAEPKLASDRYVSYQDNIRFPMLQLVFPTVPQYHPDEVALDALADIIGRGKTSLLYKNLIKNQKAVQASASHPTSELGGEFTISTFNVPGQQLDSTEAVIRKTFVELEKRGITDDDVQRFKASREASMINRLASVSGKASQLAEFQAFTGNPNRLPEEMRKLQALTKADVQRVYNQYIKGKHAVIVSVVPKAGTPVAAAHPNNFEVSKAGFKAPADEYKGLTYVKAKDNFDRTQRPKSGANPVVKVPAYWQEELPNGLKVIGARNSEIPSVTLLLSMGGGHRLEQQNPAKVGVAALAASMLNESSQKYTGEEFTAALNKLGSTIQVSLGNDNTTVYVQSLTKNLDKTMALLQERLLHPRFDEADFARLKKQTLEGIAAQNTQPVTVANKTYARLLYGANDIMSVPTSGTAASVQSITLDDVKQFYQQNYAPNVSYLVVVGDVEQKDVMPKLTFLKSWEKKSVALPTVNPAVQPDKTRIYFVNKDGAAQSEIRVGYLALPYDATGEYYRAYLANYMLGGDFNSHINLNLREQKGYSYGAYSYFGGTRYVGPFTAQAGVRADATAPAVKEFMTEIQNYPNGVTDEEVAFLKTAVGQSDALKYETGQQKANFLGRIVEYNLPRDFVQQQQTILQNLTKEDVKTSAQKYLPANSMYIVVVGDRAKAFPGLGELGYEVVEMDADGNRVAAPAPAAAATPAAPAAAAADAAELGDKKMKRKAKDEDGKKIKIKHKEGSDAK